MSDTYPGPLDEAAFGAFILIGDAALLHRQVRNNQIAPPVLIGARLVQ